jgi:hypothetical protein
MYRLPVLILLASNPTGRANDAPGPAVSVPELAAWAKLSRDICKFDLVPPHSHLHRGLDAGGQRAFSRALSEASADIAANGSDAWCEAIHERAGLLRLHGTVRR